MRVSYLSCETPTNYGIELAIFATESFMGGGSNLGPFDPNLKALTTRPLIYCVHLTSFDRCLVTREKALVCIITAESEHFSV